MKFGVFSLYFLLLEQKKTNRWKIEFKNSIKDWAFVTVYQA